MSTAQLIADMVREGVSPDLIGRVAAALAEREVVLVKDEGAERRREKDRERKRAARVCGNPRTSAEDAEKVSPTPPSKKAPLSPPKGGSFPPPDEADDQPDLPEQLWLMASKPSRTRSGRASVSRAVAAALRKGATAEALAASVRDHCRTAGDHAKGLHRIIEGEHWRDHLAKPEAPPGPLPAAVEAHRLAHWRRTGEWKREWGERPLEAA